MLHTVKTTCAISALLVSFAATAHAANVVSDPYASYIDCSYSQAKNSGNSGCTVRGQQVTVSALSQMMAAANAYNYNAIANYNYNVTLNAGDEMYNAGGERGTAQYERGIERGSDGKDREVKQLVFFVDNKDGKTPGRGVGEGNSRQPMSAESGRQSYKIELSNEAAAQIEKAIPRKKERDEGVATSSRLGAESRGPQAKDGSIDKMEVVMPLVYASPAEIKAEEARIVQASPGAKPVIVAATTTTASEGAGNDGKAVEANIRKDSAPASTSAVAVAKSVTFGQDSEIPTYKVMLVSYEQPNNNGITVSLRIYNQATTEVVYATTIRGDVTVAYRVREIALPVTANLAQGGSATPGENVRDQSYTGGLNASPSSSAPAEPMDKDNPDSGKGGSGTFK